MNFLVKFLIVLALICWFSFNMIASVFASGHLAETRYCWPIVRDANGVIVRSTAVTREFKKLYPCPSTGLTTGPCPGWQVDHVISLAACGCDSVSNAQWLPDILKSGPGTLPKDRWERSVYKCRGTDIAITPMPDSQKFRLGVVPR